MKKTLIVIDMQNDFIDGSLGTPQAQAIVSNVAKKIEEYRNRCDNVIFTKDTHFDDYLETKEGESLPVKHCIWNTEGWQIYSGLQVPGDFVISKETFGFCGWETCEIDLDALLNKDLIEVEIVGLCTDICVVSNALILKAMFPETRISVDAECCAGTTMENHYAALQVMKSCQIEVKNLSTE